MGLVLDYNGLDASSTWYSLMGRTYLLILPLFPPTLTNSYNPLESTIIPMKHLKSFKKHLVMSVFFKDVSQISERQKLSDTVFITEKTSLNIP